MKTLRLSVVAPDAAHRYRHGARPAVSDTMARRARLDAQPA